MTATLTPATAPAPASATAHTAAVPATGPAPRTAPSFATLSGLEVRKSLSTRSGRAVAAIAVLLGPLGILVGSATGGGGVPAAMALGITGMLTGLVLLALGVLSTAGEWTHRSVQTTFLLVPRRGRVLAAKVAAMTVLGAGLASVGGAATVGLLSVIPDPVAWTGAGRAALTFVAAGTAFAVTGAGIGAALGNSPAALTGTYLALLGVMPVLRLSQPGLAEKTDPVDAVLGLATGHGGTTQVLVLTGWVVVSTVAGAVATRRRAVA